MPIPTPSSVVRIRLVHGLTGNLNMGSRIFYSYTDASQPTIADLNTLAGNIAARWVTNLAGMFTSAGALEQVIVDDLAFSTGNQGVYSTPQAGTRAGGYFDRQVATQINFRIGRHYRGGKPKIFVPYGTLTDAAGGASWTTGYVGAMNTAWAAFQTALNGLVAGGITLGTQQSVSYFHGPTNNTSKSPWARRNVPAPRGVPVVDPIIGVSTSSFISQQRRRASR